MARLLTKPAGTHPRSLPAQVVITVANGAAVLLIVVPSRSPVTGLMGMLKFPFSDQTLPLLTVPTIVLVVTTWPNWLNRLKPSEKQLETARLSRPPACNVWLLMTRLLAAIVMSPAPVGALMVPLVRKAQPAIKLKLPLLRP